MLGYIQNRHRASAFGSFSVFATLWLMLASLLCQAQSTPPPPNIAQLYVTSAQARPTAPQQANGAAYLQLENRGKTADKLLRIRSTVAAQVQLHTMSMEGDMMKMREIEHIPLPPASKLVMAPGNGPHVMLLGLKQALKVGQTLALTLEFEKAGKLDVQVKVMVLPEKSSM
jgi:periplasmic copper chaperone A